MRRAADLLAGALALGYAALAVAAALAQGKPAPAAEHKRGEYLAKIMDCGGCHTPGALAGKPDEARAFAGSDIGFAIPELGVFYPPNLTSDATTGLGNWTVAEIVTAVRTGVRPDGRVLAPVMPWHAYAALTDADARALAVYLKSLPPLANAVPAMVGPGETAKAPYLGVVLPK